MSKEAVRQVAVGSGVVVAAFVIIVLAAGLVRAFNPQDHLSSAVNSGEFQAVFLTNGQVYFGKLTSTGGDFSYLRDVYYLSSGIAPQSGKKARTVLVHLGNEIHAPEDLMIISKRQILFVENLAPTGEVSRSIRASPGP